MTGQPLPPPADPRAAAIFAPLPVDEEPAVAQLRHDELARTMAGSRYQTMPPPWRAAFDAEYARMKLCAGVQTIPEQQAAQQAAQQQADAQRKAAEQTKQQGAAAQQHAQQQHDAQESHADRQAAAARDDHRLEAQQAAAQQREQLQLAARQGTALDPGASAGALVS